jgi:hypothetical protein
MDLLTVLNIERDDETRKKSPDRTPVKAGVPKYLNFGDSCFLRKDENKASKSFYESISVQIINNR